MSRIKAAIIDDGVDVSQFSNIQSFTVKKDLSIKKDFTAAKQYNHATTCMKIIQKFTDISNVDWYSIKILDDDSKLANINQFLKALELCAELGVKIIMPEKTEQYNSSIYLAINDFEYVEKYVNRLCDMGVIIVAASSNKGTVTYPAYMNNVIGVKNNYLLKDDKYIFNENPMDHIDFSAASAHILRSGKELNVTMRSNSYAAPIITAKVITILNNNESASFEKVYNLLMKNSVNKNCKVNTVYFDPLSCADRVLLNIVSDKDEEQGFVDKVKSLFAPTDKDELQTEQKLYMIGFNAGFTLSNTSQGIKAQITSGTISQKPDNDKIMYTIPSLPGSSGSPVVNEYGKLVAVNFAGMTGTQSFNYGIQSKRVLQFVNND